MAAIRRPRAAMLRPNRFGARTAASSISISAEEGRDNLKRIDAETGKVEPLTEGDHDVFAYNATPDAARAALVISTPTNIGDLFVLDVASRKAEQLTHINDELFSKLDLTEPAMIWYQSFDGKRIQAWVQRPPDFQEGKKYPLILNIHGGPHARLRLHLRSRDAVDGGQRLRGAVSESARQHDVRPGFRKHHPVSLSR